MVKRKDNSRSFWYTNLPFFIWNLSVSSHLYVSTAAHVNQCHFIIYPNPSSRLWTIFCTKFTRIIGEGNVLVAHVYICAIISELFITFDVRHTALFYKKFGNITWFLFYNELVDSSGEIHLLRKGLDGEGLLKISTWLYLLAILK